MRSRLISLCNVQRAINTQRSSARGSPLPFQSSRSHIGCEVVTRVSQSRLFHASFSATMSNTKSESEWRAILSPEQVSAFNMFPFSDIDILSSFHSSASFVRKALNAQERANTTSSTTRVYTLVQDVGHRSTRAPPNSRVVVVGLHSSMVSRMHPHIRQPCWADYKLMSMNSHPRSSQST